MPTLLSQSTPRLTQILQNTLHSFTAFIFCLLHKTRPFKKRLVCEIDWIVRKTESGYGHRGSLGFVFFSWWRHEIKRCHSWPFVRVGWSFVNIWRFLCGQFEHDVARTIRLPSFETHWHLYDVIGMCYTWCSHSYRAWGRMLVDDSDFERQLCDNDVVLRFKVYVNFAPHNFMPRFIPK